MKADVVEPACPRILLRAVYLLYYLHSWIQISSKYERVVAGSWNQPQ